MVTTVRPKASATPTRPMPISGNFAAKTALPQPPKTSQKVPMNSAPSFFDSGMAEPPIDLRAMVKRQAAETVPVSLLWRLTPPRETMKESEHEQRHDDDRAKQNIGDGPADQITEQREHRKYRRPCIGQDAARGDAEPAEEQ